MASSETALMLDNLRRRRALAYQGLWRGQTPRVESTLNYSIWESFWRAVGMGLVLGGLAGVASAYIFQQASNTAWAVGNVVFCLGFLAGLLYPYTVIFLNAIWKRQKPDFSRLDEFTFTEKSLANAIIAFLLLQAINFGYASFAKHNQASEAKPKTIHSHWHSSNLPLPKQNQYNPPKLDLTLQMSIWLSLTILLSLLMFRLSKQPVSLFRSPQRVRKTIVNKPIPFGLWLGESTGIFASLWHQASLAPSQQVALFGDNAAQNIVVFGGTGSGKTTRIIHPLLIQLFDQGCGGLIFDIKGNFHRAVQTFSEQTQRAYEVIGVDATPFNLLAGLPPEIAASFLKSTFLLGSSGHNESFWIDTATELCRNALGVLSFLPEHYSLYGLHCYLFDSAWREERNHELFILKNTFDDKQQRLLLGYQRYQETIFNQFDDKVQSGVKASVAQVLAPFNHPDLIDTFCISHPNGANIENVLEGNVYLVNLPLSRWGLGGKVAYTFIKLRFFNIMQQRPTHPYWNQDRFVFLLCDEYQEIVSANKDGLSDLNFWDKSRSSKTVGIISAQSVSSFYAAIGHRDMANALLQNFRQKICFRTEDQTTIEMLNSLLGNVEITRISTSESSGQTSGEKSSSHKSKSVTLSTHEKPLLDGQFVRTLSSDYAIALLSYGGMGFDDVLKVQPYYV